MDIFIYFNSDLRDTRDVLEDDLEEFLGRSDAVTGGGLGKAGWNIDIEIFEPLSSETLIEQLMTFLRGWQVPDDTWIVVEGIRYQVY